MMLREKERESERGEGESHNGGIPCARMRTQHTRAKCILCQCSWRRSVPRRVRLVGSRARHNARRGERIGRYQPASKQVGRQAGRTGGHIPRTGRGEGASPGISIASKQTWLVLVEGVDFYPV